MPMIPALSCKLAPGSAASLCRSYCVGENVQQHRQKFPISEIQTSLVARSPPTKSTRSSPSSASLQKWPMRPGLTGSKCMRVTRATF